jgi:hypothetical protein
MSSRPSKKAALAPGQVVGRSPASLLLSSPQRKLGSKQGKRSAPQPKPLSASAAAFVPNASFHPGTSSSCVKPSKSFAAAARSNAAPSGSSKKGVRVDESKNKVVEVDIADGDDDDEYWEDMVSSEDEKEEHIGEVDAAGAGVSSKSGMESDDDVKFAAAASSCASVQTGVGSDASFVASDEESDDDPPVMYADLVRSDGSIR